MLTAVCFSFGAPLDSLDKMICRERKSVCQRETAKAEREDAFTKMDPKKRTSTFSFLGAANRIYMTLARSLVRKNGILLKIQVFSDP